MVLIESREVSRNKLTMLVIMKTCSIAPLINNDAS